MQIYGDFWIWNNCRRVANGVVEGERRSHKWCQDRGNGHKVAFPQRYGNITVTPNLMYMLNVHVTEYGRQTVPDRGVVTGQVMWSTKYFFGSNHITETAEPKVAKFCTYVGYINFSNSMIYH